jgi:4a-hydroxytetrahydrobiopterin dehydratase
MWQEKDNKLERRFEFTDFQGALDFVKKVAVEAEASQHHPDICFGWGYVIVSLTTHSEGKVTDKDRVLATKIDGLL